jgi:hypothetical protein
MPVLTPKVIMYMVEPSRYKYPLCISSTLLLYVAICNHAHKKLFPFVITHPHSLLSLPIPILCPQETHVSLPDRHVVKLPMLGLLP